jgi:hypothetical protein
MENLVNVFAASLAFMGLLMLIGIISGAVFLHSLQKLGWLNRPTPRSNPVIRTIGLLVGFSLIMFALIMSAPWFREIWPVGALVCIGAGVATSGAVSYIERAP